MAYYDNAPSHKPQGKKSFGREKWVEEGSEYRGARHGGRPSGKRDDNRAYGEKKSFGDRKPYGEKKSFGDRKPYGEKKSYGDRKPYERRDRYDRRPEMADERPAPPGGCCARDGAARGGRSSAGEPAGRAQPDS